MISSITISKKISLAYSAVCKDLCRELGLPQTAFDILMFLGNHPQYKTASEIVEIRRIKANLVSINVDRLVREGYLSRNPVHIGVHIQKGDQHGADHSGGTHSEPNCCVRKRHSR